MARRTYGRFGTDLWNEDSFRELTVEEQWAYNFAKLQPGLSRCGVLDYRPSRWAKSARGLTAKRLDSQYRRLNDTKHVVLDEDFEQLFVRTFVRHDGVLTQPMVVAAMVTDFRDIASPTIRIAFLNELRRIWHLPTLPEKERAGLALVFGAQADASRVRAAIGEGLVVAMADAVAKGYVEPFSKPFSEGLPEVSRELFASTFTEPSSEPPRAYARADVPASTGSGPGTGDDAEPSPPPEPPAARNGQLPQARGDQADDAIAQARRRAGDKALNGWDRETVLRICHGAAAKFETTAAEAYDRLALLAGMPETHSPGRLLEPAAWDWAGSELLRMARDKLAREQSTAALEAQKAEHAATAETQAARRRRIAKLAEADPDGWAQAQVEAAAELEAEGVAPLAALVAARALDICERQAAS